MNKVKFIRQMYIFSISILFTLIVMPIYLPKLTYATTDKGFANRGKSVVHVKIGASASFSGSRRTPSINGLFGILAMVDWINDDKNQGIVVDGKRIKFDFIISDDKSDDDEVARIYKNLVKKSSKVDFLIGPYSSVATQIAVGIAEQSSKLILCPLGASDVIYDEPSNWRIQVIPPSSKFYDKQVEMLSQKAESLGVKVKVVLAFEDDLFSVSVLDAVKPLIEADPNFELIFNSLYPDDGGDLLVPNGDMDVFVNGMVQSITENTNEEDIVVIIGGGHNLDGLAFAQLLDEKEYRPDSLALLISPSISSFFCNVAMDEEGCSSGYAEGITTVVPWQPLLVTFIEGETDVAAGLDWFGPSHDEALVIIKEKNGGETPSFDSGLGGQTILALAHAISEGQSINKKTVRDTLKEVKFQSCFGNFGVNQETGKQELLDMLVEQWQVISDTPGLHVVWPADQATSEFIFPMP